LILCYLYAFWQDGIAHVVDDDVGQTGEREEEVDGGEADVADVIIRVAAAVGRAHGQDGGHDGQAGEHQLDDSFPRKTEQ